MGAVTGALNTAEQTLIIPSDAKGGENFGKSLSVFENTMAVGAPGDNSLGFSAGSVYMYDFISGDWNQRSKLAASSTSDNDKFGFSVSVFDNTLAVGAVFKLRIIGSVPVSEAGVAYIFLRGGNSWSENQQLVANDGQAYDHFGISVSVYENSLLIGASDDDVPSSDGPSAGKLQS